jgi:NAD-dependent deacetylase
LSIKTGEFRMTISKNLIEFLRKSKKVLFFTGAGISAESGIDTFRGKGGIWNNVSAAELASLNGFIENPNLVWEWYQHRRKIIEKTAPNKGHLAIADFENLFDEVTVVTQNVDDLHERAGSSNIIKLHGDILKNICIDCGKHFGIDEYIDRKEVPICDSCGGLIRPKVVWFGEQLPIRPFQKAEEKAKEADVCIIVGTSAVVYPAAYIPIAAKDNGAKLLEINIEKTELTEKSDYSIIGKAGDVLPEIYKFILGK